MNALIFLSFIPCRKHKWKKSTSIGNQPFSQKEKEKNEGRERK
jgi:hypothetical protein